MTYLLDNASPVAGQRFGQLERLFDSVTMAGLTPYLRHGMTIWEVGCGSGSIATAMAYRGASYVLATDLDLTWTSYHRHPRVTYQQHDLMTDDIVGRYDLIHARLVVEHTTDPVAAIGRLVDSLAPRGTVVIEELDPMLPYVIDATTRRHDLINQVGRAFTTSLLAAGADPGLGHRLPGLMTKAGLTAVTSRGVVVSGYGKGLTTELMKSNVRQCAGQLLQADTTLTMELLNDYLTAMDDPTVLLTLPVFFTTTGSVE